MPSRLFTPWSYPFAAIVAALVCLNPALAVPPVITPYPDAFGSTRNYLNIVEASTEGNPFGAPVLLGDTLLFQPENFLSESNLLLSGSDITDSQLRFSIDALPGQFIDTIYFVESGVYTLGNGGATGGIALAAVATPIFYHVREIDGVAIDGPRGMVLLPIAPFDGMYSIDQIGPVENAPWQGELLLDIASIIAADPNFSGRATLVEITLDNTLGSVNFPGEVGDDVQIAENGGSPNYYALIRKNRLQITVPESSTAIWISVASSGIVALFLRRCRPLRASPPSAV